MLDFTPAEIAAPAPKVAADNNPVPMLIPRSLFQVLTPAFFSPTAELTPAAPAAIPATAAMYPA